MPNKENIRKWVVALRSGEYQQGHSTLYNATNDTYCCLGVACEVALANGIELPKRMVGVRTFYNDNSADLPIKVVNWLGLTANDPMLLTSSDDENTAIGLNDSKRYTFNHIADAIERTYLNDRE